MHSEPGVVAESKLWLSYVTAAGTAGYTLTIAKEEIRSRGLASLAGRSLIASALVFCFFEVLPHYPVGIWSAAMHRTASVLKETASSFCFVVLLGRRPASNIWTERPTA